MFQSCWYQEASLEAKQYPILIKTGAAALNILVGMITTIFYRTTL